MSLPQNQKLEELFDLPPTEFESNDDTDSQTASDAAQLPVMPETLATLDKIEAALPAVRGLESSDQEMDDLARRAQESFDDLMNLGMQVDSRYASEIFAVAGAMLGHAITAKTAKMNKKLKMIDMQMKKVKLDREGGQEDTALPMGQGYVLDRNELLKTLLSKTPADQSNGDKR